MPRDEVQSIIIGKMIKVIAAKAYVEHQLGRHGINTDRADAWRVLEEAMKLLKTQLRIATK